MKTICDDITLPAGLQSNLGYGGSGGTRIGASLCLATFVSVSLFACAGSDSASEKVVTVDSALTATAADSTLTNGVAETDVGSLLSTAGVVGTVPAAARVRAREVRDHLAKRHFANYRIISTTHTNRGQTIDWVDPHDLDPSYDTRTPPPPAPSPDGTFSTASVTPDALRGMEDRYLPGPAGAVPVLRPNLSYYISGESKLGSIAEFLASIRPPQGASTFRLYAGYGDIAATAVNTGTQAWVNLWDIQGVPDSEMSLIQTSISSCQSTAGAATETVEWGVQKQKALYGDTQLHHFIYFNTNGYASTGNYVGGYNQNFLGFVPYAGAFPPGAIVGGPYSTAGGAQYERRLAVIFYNSAWWIQDYVSPTAYTWLGYYPIGTTAPNINFKYIKTGACGVNWYGEVSDATPTTWNTSDMAAGSLVSAGYGRVGYVRDIINVRTSGNVWFSTTAGSFFGDPQCYGKTAVTTSTTSGWNRYFYYGGPGYTTGAAGTCL